MGMLKKLRNKTTWEPCPSCGEQAMVSHGYETWMCQACGGVGDLMYNGVLLDTGTRLRPGGVEHEAPARPVGEQLLPALPGMTPQETQAQHRQLIDWMFDAAAERFTMALDAPNLPPAITEVCDLMANVVSPDADKYKVDCIRSFAQAGYLWRANERDDGSNGDLPLMAIGEALATYRDDGTEGTQLLALASSELAAGDVNLGVLCPGGIASGREFLARAFEFVVAALLDPLPEPIPLTESEVDYAFRFGVALRDCELWEGPDQAPPVPIDIRTALLPDGARAASRCGSCDTPAAAGSRFCAQCGAAIDA